MIRLLGATLLAAGCAWIGFRASWEMRARGRAMGEVAEGLELLERELELGGAPLPHLVDDLSGRTRGQARLLFQDLRQLFIQSLIFLFLKLCNHSRIPVAVLTFN